MLSPSDISLKIIQINNARMSSGLDNTIMHNNKITALYMEVLNEIKNGSIDPKSIAFEALKITPTWHRK